MDRFSGPYWNKFHTEISNDIVNRWGWRRCHLWESTALFVIRYNLTNVNEIALG